ncbi:MAG: dihydrolipoamide acetyltransferase family protein, partial [Bacteroidota bacterium]
IFASPLARKLAQTHGCDLATIQGTGPNGRIVKHDVEAVLASQAALLPSPSTTTPLPTAPHQEAYQDIPVSTMRKTIAKRLSESAHSTPHFSLTIQVNMDKVVGAYPGISAYAPVKVSFNDFILKATAMALRKNLATNVAWLGNSIRHYQHIHIGVAMAVEDGLLVPVVRFADQKSLAQIAAEVQSLSKKAHEQQLMPKDWEGNTFTVSNLGMMGIESFTPIINPPAACILAVGEIKQEAVVKADAVVPGYVMKATLACDHRAIDGATGAAFLKSFKELLENPVSMLVS